MKFRCPECQQRIKVELKDRSRKVRCPKCRTQYRMPCRAEADSGQAFVQRVVPMKSFHSGEAPSIPWPPGHESEQTDPTPATPVAAQVSPRKTARPTAIPMAHSTRPPIMNTESPVAVPQPTFHDVEPLDEEELGADVEAFPTKRSWVVPILAILVLVAMAGTFTFFVIRSVMDTAREFGQKEKERQELAERLDPRAPKVPLALDAEVKSGSLTPRRPANSAPSPILGKPSDYVSPTFPDPGRGSRFGGVIRHEIRFADQKENVAHMGDKAPGKLMQLRIIIPENHVEGTKIPLVLVAPAGTNLMTGIHMPDRKYTAETQPYVDAGMMVCVYTIDGVKPDGELTVSLLNYLHFWLRNAEGGTINGRIALDYVLDKFPDVDRNRIYTAGHSSAGTAALQLASADSRIKKCAAYAPICFLDRRLGPVLDDPQISKEVEGIHDYVRGWSPHRRVEQFHCPVMVFHAVDDGNEPWQNTRDFAKLLTRNGKDIKMVSSRRGGHYQSMIDEGIPSAIRWFNDDE